MNMQYTSISSILWAMKSYIYTQFGFSVLVIYMKDFYNVESPSADNYRAAGGGLFIFSPLLNVGWNDTVTLLRCLRCYWHMWYSVNSSPRRSGFGAHPLLNQRAGRSRSKKRWRHILLCNVWIQIWHIRVFKLLKEFLRMLFNLDFSLFTRELLIS